MNQLSHEEELMVRYLLGDLPEAEQVQIEKRFLSDDNFFELLSAAEDELRYDYALGHLSARERDLFEKRFLKSPQERGAGSPYSGVEPIHCQAAVGRRREADLFIDTAIRRTQNCHAYRFCEL